jgi:phosphate transport system substrate-binding protein
MNDAFLHRIRTEPPPHFIASLKARLNRLEKESLARQPTRRSGFIVGSLIAGAALAAGFFFARTMHSPPLDNTRPISMANPSRVDGHQYLGPTPQATDSATSDVGVMPEGHPADENRTPGQFAVGATVAIYPIIKEAARVFTNMNTNPPYPEPTFSMMSSAAVFSSLCSSNNSVGAVVVDRRILPGELDVCHRFGKHITEVKLGYEAIVLARSKLYGSPKLSTRSIFLALAREVPDPLHPEELIKNPNVTWDQVDSALQHERIDVSGPPLSAAVGIALRDLLLKAGCLALPTIASLKETDPERFEEVCGSVRTDGLYRVSDASQGAGNNPFDFVGYLQANPEAIVLLGYREEILQSWNLAASSIDGVTPSRLIIDAGAYPGSRALYLYANTHVPGMREFISSILSSLLPVSGRRNDTVVIFSDSAELRTLREHVWTLPDLNF